ncbi:hypothetical protein DRI96_03960 [Candidatus Aerophobetes bacterium]|uniref:LysM domain-containing protein n=1 Tax=Aerophobetes bacterium TaxID=2030807 RepID=A0A662DAK0_UNCAE|nr:MAG: hypothetical protein DRI96_03960 [Candidatus Aerophobetes bacterium]
MQKKKKLAIIITGLSIGLIFSHLLQAATFTYYRYYIVQKGDTLYDISKEYGVSIKTIKRKNNLRSDRIYPNQKLILPITVKGVYHVVKKYETLWRICKAYKVNIDDVIRLNRISDPGYIRVGQKLFIPGAKKVVKISIPEKIALNKEVNAAIAKRKKGEESSSTPSPKVIAGRGSLIWPVKSNVFKYEKKSFGIDIFAPAETRIIAPARGKIYFSGWLRGYGKTIIIEHSQLGLYTCYMHNSLNLVKKGDVVEKGETIAVIGNTGTVDKTVLHFEIRRADDGKPVNPLDYLPLNKTKKKGS